MIHFTIYSVNEMIILKIFALKKKRKDASYPERTVPVLTVLIPPG